MRAITLLLAAALCCGSANALVPRQINYQGYLANPGGTPVNASVTMVLNLYTVATGGATLYTETQTVPVTNGVFNVRIGSEAPLALPFDVPYYLGIMVGADPEMTPREELVSSPYAIRSASTEALAATAAVPAAQVIGAVSSAASFTGSLAGDVTGTQSATVIAAVGGVSAANVAAGANLANAAASANTANTIVKRDASGNFAAGTVESTTGGVKYPDGNTQTKALANCSAEGDVAVMHSGAWVCRSALPHYMDNGNGTVTDSTTGLMWEKKIASSDPLCTNAAQASRDVRCEQNFYTWSAASPYTEPTGTLYSDSLQQLNGLNYAGAPCFAGYCDWRIPTIGELRSILAAQYPAACPASPCIDAIFGPTQANFYWSSSSLASSTFLAWVVGFGGGSVINVGKGDSGYTRAVRSGR